MLEKQIANILSCFSPVVLEVKIEEDLLSLVIVSSQFKGLDMWNRIKLVLDLLNSYEEIAGRYTILVLGWIRTNKRLKRNTMSKIIERRV